MKIRRSARVMVVTIVALTVFSALIVWHNRPPGILNQQEKLSLLKQLSYSNPKLRVFVGKVKWTEDFVGFYSVGAKGTQSWPTDIFGACYSDPIARLMNASTVNTSSQDDLELIRYRSLEDFLLLLSETEEAYPGTMAQMDFLSYQIVKESTASISMRMFAAMIIGITGLLLVRFINKPPSHPSSNSK